MAKQNAFAAKLRWLDEKKTYLIEEITQLPDALFNYKYRGEFSGMQLKSQGLPIDLDAGEECCAAFWIQEKTSSNPQVLYADAAVVGYVEKTLASGLAVQVRGQPRATGRLIVFKPGPNGVEDRAIELDAQGRAAVTFDATTITQAAQKIVSMPVTTTVGRRDTATAGNWHGKYGATAAWLAGQKIEPANGFTLKTAAPVYVWPKDDGTPRVLDLPTGHAGVRVAACWTTGDRFTMCVDSPSKRPYRLTVYVMDYDNGKRGMEITVKSRDGKVYDRQTANAAETNQGIYFSWDVTGRVTIQARKTEGCNAAVSGVFVDAGLFHSRDDAAGARSRREGGKTQPADGFAHLRLRGHLGPRELRHGRAWNLSGYLVPTRRLGARYLSQLAQHTLELLLVAGSQVEMDRIQREELPGARGDFQRLGRQYGLCPNVAGDTKEGP